MASESPSARVFIAHTNLDFRTLIKVGLARDGHTVAEAADGETALAMIARQHPQILIIDLVLPRLSGIKVLDELRKTHDWASTIPVIAVIDERTREDDIDGMVALDPRVEFVKIDWAPDHVIAKIEEMLSRAGMPAESVQ